MNKTPQEQLRNYIIKNKLRNTEERYFVLEEIIALNSHFTTQELYEHVKTKFQISRASIYNIIDLFIDASLIVRHPFPGREIEYELRQRAITHHHKICTKCGKVKEFTDLKISKAINKREFTAFDTEFHMVYLYGLCKKCRPRNKKK